jgi:hypothetical protein
MSEPAEFHTIRRIPMWLVEVDLSALGLDEEAVADLLDRIKISLTGPEGAEYPLNTWRAVHDEQPSGSRVRVDAWFTKEDS